jgi:hypothetical protein
MRGYARILFNLTKQFPTRPYLVFGGLLNPVPKVNHLVYVCICRPLQRGIWLYAIIVYVLDHRPLQRGFCSVYIQTIRYNLDQLQRGFQC